MNDYMIRVDETGQPYIAHAGWFERAKTTVGNVANKAQSAGKGMGRGFRQNVKYIMKVGDRNNPRYLYTQEEVQAYLRGGRQALQNAGQRVANTGRQAVQNVRQAGQRAVNTVKDKAGVDERQRAVAAVNRTNAEWQKAGNNRTEAYNRAVEDQAKAVSEYQKTALGRAETAWNTATRPVRNAVNNARNNTNVSLKFRDQNGNEVSGRDVARQVGNAAVNGVKSKAERMREEFRKDTDTVKEKAGEAANKVRETGRNAVDSVKNKVNETVDNAKEAAEGVRIYNEWKNNPSKETYDAVKNNKTAMAMRQAQNDFYDKLDEMAFKAAKGKEGEDIRKEFEKAAEEYIKNPTDANYKKREQLYKDWLESPHGQFIDNNFLANVSAVGLSDAIKYKVSEMGDKIKEKGKAAQEEKQAAQAEKNAAKIKERQNEIFENDFEAQEYYNKAVDISIENGCYTEHDAETKLRKENPAAYAEYKKLMNEYEDNRDKVDKMWDQYAKEAENAGLNKARFGHYNENDPDFADESYDKADRLGDTNFLTFKRDDGRYVILEEDMKWVLPEGVDGHDPAIRKAINDFEAELESRTTWENGLPKHDYTWQDAQRMMTDYIDEGIEEALKNNKK